jgi:hypothetical protein
LHGLAARRPDGNSKNWLGHKSLEVTQICLDSEIHDPEEQKKLDSAGKF